MKNLFILFLFLTNICFAQKQVDYTGFNSAVHNQQITYLQGSWGIDKLITQEVHKEYILFPRDTKEQFHYGNNITFKPDGTFISAYSAFCGNDRFTTTTGKYKILSEDYICFMLEKESTSGDGLFDVNTNERVYRTEQVLNLDLGLFRIYREDNKIQFYKSDGNPANDKKTLEYIEMLTRKSQELSSHFPPYTYIDWRKMEHYDRFTKVEDIVAFIMAQHQIPDYEILSDRGFPNANLILLKVEGKYRYVVWKAKVSHIVKVDVALYDDSFFEELETLVHKTDKNKRLKKKVVKETEYHSSNPLQKNTITIFSKNGETQKLVYDVYNERGHFKVAFYNKDGKPAVIKIEPEKSENFNYYIYNWEHHDGAVMQPVVQGWSFSGVRLMYHKFLKKYN